MSLADGGQGLTTEYWTGRDRVFVCFCSSLPISAAIRLSMSAPMRSTRPSAGRPTATRRGTSRCTDYDHLIPPEERLNLAIAIQYDPLTTGSRRQAAPYTVTAKREISLGDAIRRQGLGQAAGGILCGTCGWSGDIVLADRVIGHEAAE